ncbi:MAG: energy-coupling factor ABC transporter permease [Thermofilaceae archaeon]|nr:energy-coupling factor ABC transporter permease [Thermofilaceae archaeon]MCX8179906.1 energy-coupling factor ABC transporter permease [Thermofilaceae archaeon]MDW8004403.1 energy-coupling factor ABC transporter permease [Thermofilaceae archaeon]
MHIPDGFLDPVTAGVTYLIALSYTVYAFKKARSSRVELLAPVSASIFVAQMLNWPLPGGTSLHFVGGALAGILLGPWNGYMAMFLVLLVQTLIFHDGGITAFGANLLNMAILSVYTGYVFYKSFARFPGRGKVIGSFLGGWLSLVVAGLACGLQLGVSTQFPHNVTLAVPVMAGWHAVLGLAEGVITAAVVSYISSKSPELLTGGAV